MVNYNLPSEPMRLTPFPRHPYCTHASMGTNNTKVRCAAFTMFSSSLSSPSLSASSPCSEKYGRWTTRIDHASTAIYGTINGDIYFSIVVSKDHSPVPSSCSS